MNKRSAACEYHSPTTVKSAGMIQIKIISQLQWAKTMLEHGGRLCLHEGAEIENEALPTTILARAFVIRWMDLNADEYVRDKNKFQLIWFSFTISVIWCKFWISYTILCSVLQWTCTTYSIHTSGFQSVIHCCFIQPFNAFLICSRCSFTSLTPGKGEACCPNPTRVFCLAEL